MYLEGSQVRGDLQTCLALTVISCMLRDQNTGEISIAALLQLRREAARATYEEGILEPYCTFEYRSSNSLSSVSLKD